MRRFVTGRFIVLAALTLMIVVLMLAGCGSGGGSGSASGSASGSVPSSVSDSGSSPQVLSGNASAGVPLAKQLTLTWDPVAGATSYTLYWSTVPEVSSANGTQISGISTTSYVHTGLAAGTTYYYVVTAVNSSSESAASVSASGTTAL